MKSSVNLDFMRSAAVLCVVVAHSLLYLGRNDLAGWSGISGVCMFFVHTSLVLMFSLERDPDTAHFYVRRMFRIYPLWIVMVLVVTLFRLPQFPPDFAYRACTFKSFLTNLMLTFNVLHPSQEIVGAGWTLPIEVDMYLFLPALFYFARSLRSIWPLIILSIFIVFFDRTYFPGFNSALPVCVPYFLPGIMAYVIWKRQRNRVLPAWSFPLFLLMLLGVDHFYGSFSHGWIFCTVLGLALPHFRELTWKPVRVAAHLVAKYSYGIYLTHITALVVFVRLLREHGLAVRLAGFVVVLIGAPMILYHLVEEPMIRLGAKAARKLDGKPVPRVTEQSLNMEPAP